MSWLERGGLILLVVMNWIVIGDTVLCINSQGRYQRWKLRHSSGRALLVCLLWPLFLQRKGKWLVFGE